MKATASPSVSSKLIIHSALYGSWHFDDVSVTYKLNGLTKDALVIPVNNNLVDRDPAPNKPKRIQVEYSYGNSSRHIVVRSEHSILVLPEDSDILKLASEVSKLRSEQ